MRGKLLLILFAFIAVACEELDKVDPNFAAKVAGSYTMTTYVTQSGSSTANLSGNDKLRITRIDDNHVDIVIDYYDPNSNDVELTNVYVEQSGSSYKFSANYSNGSVSGTCDATNVYVYVSYTNGNWVKTDGVK